MSQYRRTKDESDLPLFVDPAPEEVREIHERFEGSVGEYLDCCRAALVELARVRPVTTDDLWSMIERGRIPQPPEGFHVNAFGGVFTDGRFRAVGWKRSEREGSNGNLLRTWERAA